MDSDAVREFAVGQKSEYYREGLGALGICIW